jgi:hypothetical protein
MLEILYTVRKYQFFSRKQKKSGDFRYTFSGKEKCQAKNNIFGNKKMRQISSKLTKFRIFAKIEKGIFVSTPRQGTTT